MADRTVAYAQGDSRQERVSELDILLEASESAASHTLDVVALLEALAGLVRRVVDYELYSLLLPNEDGELRIAHSVGYGAELVRSLRLPRGAGLTGRAASIRQTVRVDDVRREPGYVQGVDSVRSEVAVPLVARDRVVAVLDLQSADPNAFDQRVSDLLELIASRFSLALDVAQLYQVQSRQHSTLRTLRQIAHEFSQILKLGDLLKKIASLLHSLMPYDAMAIYLADPGRPLLRHYFGVKQQERVRWRDIGIGEGLVGEAARTRQPVLVEDTTLDPRYIESMPGIRSEVAIPLLLKNELVGVVDLESVRPGRFSAEDRKTLTLLAPQIAAAIENARLYEEKALSEARLEGDLAAARALQSSMLPGSGYRAPGIEIAARNEPAAMVSGDFYDFYERGDSVGILNADVSGKGAAAALYAALASGLMGTAAARRLRPAQTLAHVNASLLKRRIEARFVAALLAEWNDRERRLTLSAAGMPYPIVWRRGRLERLALDGIPLGLFPDTAYEDSSLVLEPGDFAVTVSDGFSESISRDGEEYGDERLCSVLQQCRSASADGILERLFADVAKFGAGEPATDDRTAVVMRVTA